MDRDRSFVAVAYDNMTNSRTGLLIQADAFLIVKTDVEKSGSAPAHPNIDMPFSGITLADMNVGYRPTVRPERRQLAF